jgi:RNA polymerase sigma factor (sigma-70 family)
MISDDMALVREYAQSNSEQAFATLASRHVNLVYSVALRQVRDPHLAEEITQSVFIILAGKAKSLSPKTILSGWLCRTARYVSANTLSIQRRRQFREQEAHMESILNKPEPGVWNQIAPLLDEALNCLGEKEHDAVVLRFFDGKELKQVGAAMGTTEDAARMRVNRGVEKLRDFFTKKGVTLSATAITGAVAANSVQAAPVGLAATITAGALSGTTITTTAVIAATKAIGMTTLQKTIITATLAAAVGTGIYEARKASNAWAEVETLKQHQAGQIQQLARERDDATSRVAGLQEDNVRLNRNASELLKLRGEVARLRNASKELALKDAAVTAGATNANDQIDLEAKALSAKAHLLKQLFEQMPERKIPELRYWGDQSLLIRANGADLETDAGISRAMSDRRQEAKELFATLLIDGLDNYTRANAGQLPTDISQLKPYFPGEDDVILQRYQVIKTGNVSNLQSGEKVIAEKAAVDEHYDTLFQFGIRTWTWQGIGANNLHGSGGSNRAAQ